MIVPDRFRIMCVVHERVVAGDPAHIPHRPALTNSFIEVWKVTIRGYEAMRGPRSCYSRGRAVGSVHLRMISGRYIGVRSYLKSVN